MQLSLSHFPIEPAIPAAAAAEPVKSLYFALLASDTSEANAAAAVDYLKDCLQSAADVPCDLPDDPEALMDWVVDGTAEVGREYQAYLNDRMDGAPRRYFGNKAHAQYFLRGVAPTKLVDGAWLYGLLQRWNDPRFTALIRTYLEELGEGWPQKNHVVLYRKLLASEGCEDWQALDDEHFVQGAIQLALAENTGRFLPEVIGFNLGYERPPLHLLITARELEELGIDPYYFTLHITVDNASTGHARKAVQGLLAALPRVGDSTDFYRRVRNGYRLNELGASTPSVIAGFNLEHEVLRVLRRKSTAGRFVHSGSSHFAGRTVNQWLAEPSRIGDFLAVLQQRGWIKRHRDPRDSYFWQLIEGPRARMFGVFSAHERQLIHDWIAGDWTPSGDGAGDPGRIRPLSRAADAQASSHTVSDNDFDTELRLMERQLAKLPDDEARMRMLLPLLAPGRHPTHVGLFATRTFARLFHLH